MKIVHAGSEILGINILPSFFLPWRPHSRTNELGRVVFLSAVSSAADSSGFSIEAGKRTYAKNTQFCSLPRVVRVYQKKESLHIRYLHSGMKCFFCLTGVLSAVELIESDNRSLYVTRGKILTFLPNISHLDPEEKIERKSFFSPHFAFIPFSLSRWKKRTLFFFL